MPTYCDNSTATNYYQWDATNGTQWNDCNCYAVDTSSAITISSGTTTNYITLTGNQLGYGYQDVTYRGFAAETEEEKERRLAAEREWQAAEKRAEELLKDLLDEEQKAELEEHRYFTVWSKDRERRYRIRDGEMGNVEWVNDEGAVLGKLCIHIKKRVPKFDSMLAQKLHLEDDDLEFLAKANVHHGRRPERLAA